MYTVYVLFDPQTDLIYYVGQTNSTTRRFKDHMTSNWKFDAIRAQGIDLQVRPVAIFETRAWALEYETRWIFHCIQTHQPLVNQTVQYPSLVACIRDYPFNFLSLHHRKRALQELRKKYSPEQLAGRVW